MPWRRSPGRRCSAFLGLDEQDRGAAVRAEGGVRRRAGRRRVRLDRARCRHRATGSSLPLEDQEEVVRVGVRVPDELAVRLREEDLVHVVAADDSRRPRLVERCERRLPDRPWSASASRNARVVTKDPPCLGRAGDEHEPAASASLSSWSVGLDRLIEPEDVLGVVRRLHAPEPFQVRAVVGTFPVPSSGSGKLRIHAARAPGVDERPRAREPAPRGLPLGLGCARVDESLV